MLGTSDWARGSSTNGRAASSCTVSGIRCFASQARPRYGELLSARRSLLAPLPRPPRDRQHCFGVRRILLFVLLWSPSRGRGFRSLVCGETGVLPYAIEAGYTAVFGGPETAQGPSRLVEFVESDGGMDGQMQWELGQMEACGYKIF